MRIVNKINQFITLAAQMSRTESLLSDAWGGGRDAWAVFFDALEEYDEKLCETIKELLKSKHTLNDKFEIFRIYFPGAFISIKCQPNQVDGFFRTILEMLPFFCNRQYSFSQIGSNISLSKAQLKKLAKEIENLLHGSAHEHIAGDEKEINNLTQILKNISSYI